MSSWLNIYVFSDLKPASRHGKKIDWGAIQKQEFKYSGDLSTYPHTPLPWRAMIFSQGAGSDPITAKLPLITGKLGNLAMASAFGGQLLHPTWIIQIVSEIAAKKVACGSMSKWDLSIQQENLLFQLYKFSRRHWVHLAKMNERKQYLKGYRNFRLLGVWNMKVELKIGNSSTYMIYKVNRKIWMRGQPT